MILKSLLPVMSSDPVVTRVTMKPPTKAPIIPTIILSGQLSTTDLSNKSAINPASAPNTIHKSIFVMRIHLPSGLEALRVVDRLG